MILPDSSNQKKAQIIYISHGGGPLPILGDSSHTKMVEFLNKLSTRLKRPDAIIVISAHWEENCVTLQGGASPDLYYDYSGFPRESYKITYPSKGNPELVKKIYTLLHESGIKTAVDITRGYDHGHFIPLKILFPTADISSFQISLLHSLDPSEHLQTGKVLSQLLNENILIIGSGFSFHNMHAFMGNFSNQDRFNDMFQNWLIDTCTHDDQSYREERIIDWEKAPYARYCHPREEHLLPLHVCMGAAGTAATVIFDDYILGKRSLAFQW
jgi:aromatic ring-opening dioxygenase catalytic subunit (LigB family)